MRGFPIVRFVAGVLTLIINVAFGLFLILDYQRFGHDVHPEPYHAPAVLAEFGVAALAAFLILLTTIIELTTRHKPAAVTQVRFELAWIGIIVFLQYSAAVVFATMYWFAFDCSVALQLDTCRMTNMVIFISSLAIPFATLCYFICFLVVACHTAKREPRESVWRTPVRAVDWDGRRRTLLNFDDTRSIASFSNKEEAIMTLKSQPSYYNTTRTITSKPQSDNALNLKLDVGYITPPPPVATPAPAAPGPMRGFTPKPLQMMQVIRQSLQSSPMGTRSGRASLTTRSDASVYSTDSPATQSGPIIPRIVRTSASTMANSMQSPILALGKVKYFQATS